MSLRRVKFGYLAALVAPLTPSIEGALCLTCGQIVDSESIVEGEPGQYTWTKVLVRHHGQEELRTFEFDSTEWDWRDLKRMMLTATFFDPNLAAENGFSAVPR